MSGEIALGGGPEFDIVRALVARWGRRARGIGDDAASLSVPDGEQLIVSTDSSVEHVHFEPEWITPTEIGYRATAAALSDLAAMAAAPLGVLVAITLPAHWTAHVEALADGIGDAAADSRVRIVGGDLTRGAELALTVTVLGSARRPVSRAGARPRDVLWVTGALGGPLAALRAWQRGAPPSAAARARFAHPEPRFAAARWLADHGAHAMIDISDGLLGDAGHLAAASGVGAVIDLDAVPSAADVTSRDAAVSGEEYELLVAASSRLDARAFTNAVGLPLTCIGDIVRGAPEVQVTVGGERVASPGGFDHFS